MWIFADFFDTIMKTLDLDKFLKMENLAQKSEKNPIDSWDISKHFFFYNIFLKNLSILSYEAFSIREGTHCPPHLHPWGLRISRIALGI